ncbi:MAG: transporter [Actinobacteria bacterium HGW-Actinobacteria-6]|jgi:drug/metabolite transporter (DMT)-like permease|nr:MAG: transporter [Actinobacteria bacterium HGW-Actinobacteria-6]
MSSSPPRTASYALIAASIVAASAGQALMKAGLGGIDGAGSAILVLASAAGRPVVWAGLIAYALSSALWLVVLSRVELSVAYPLGSLSYVIVVLVSLVLGEVVSPLRWLGVALIMFGVWAIGSVKARERS